MPRGCSNGLPEVLEIDRYSKPLEQDKQASDPQDHDRKSHSHISP
ncbi:hypothetical protein LINPERPRIM_LOCUS39662, partial [Linum perenne]